MARFRYSLQSILDIKMKMETQAKQEFSAARIALDDEEERLSALYDRKRFYESEAERLRKGVLVFLDMEENRHSILVMEDYIRAQTIQVRRAEQRLEKAREALATVMMERKTHETLKDKAFEAFLQEENRAESKVVDELTSYTYGQKKV
ncbi:MAG: flagellar export protein FliJ [Candidatus Gastranaerophilales bacterium]|nr:flagellar export protein FliJ [Candidatus Gastranaerophilales bacterium]